jgi:hypothetical protein
VPAGRGDDPDDDEVFEGVKGGMAGTVGTAGIAEPTREVRAGGGDGTLDNMQGRHWLPLATTGLVAQGGGNSLVGCRRDPRPMGWSSCLMSFLRNLEPLNIW